MARVRDDDLVMVDPPTPERPSFIKDNEQKVMELLAELGGRGLRDEDVVFEGARFVLPEKVNLKEAVSFLGDRLKQEDKTTTYMRTFRYRPMDGAHATQAALRKAFGVVGAKATQHWWGEEPPQLLTINVSPHQTEQVPWGILTLPIMPGAAIHLGATKDAEYGVLFQIIVEGPRKYRHEVEGIFKLVEEELRTNSIYKAAAIDGKDQPDYLELGGVDPTKVIFADETLRQLEANVWSLLTHTQTMRDLGLPLKRAVLLEGPYGTGKTLAAYLTAKMAVEHSWTFVMCRPGKDSLDTVMQTARLYQPSVVFFEDVDTIASTDEDAADQVTRLLDLFDGIAAKGTELMVVLTTNHAERIHKGMVRPGRLDAVIHIGSLDRNGIERMVRAVVPEDLLDPTVDFDEIAVAMEGFLPAFVKEAIDRAMRYAIARTDGRPDKFTTFDFTEAATGLRPQLELMEGAQEGKDPDPLASVMRRTISEVVHNTRVQLEDEGQLVSVNGN